MRLCLLVATLVAAAGCRSSADHSASASVAGVVVNDHGGPLAGAAVTVVGHGVATTGADGTFAFDGVVMPYDLAARSADGTSAAVYVGLTRADPSIALPAAGAGPPSPSVYSAVVQGRLLGGAGFPQPPGHAVDLLFAPDGGVGAAVGNAVVHADGTYSLTLSWSGATRVTGTLHAAQWLADTNGDAVSFDGCGDVALSAGANDSLTAQDISLAAVQGTRLDGSIAVPVGYTLGGTSLRAFFPSSRSLLLDYDTGPSLPGAYDWAAFTGDGVAYRITAFADDATNAFGEAWRVSSGTGRVDVTIPAAPVIAALPAVKEGATLSWSAVAGAVYDLLLSPTTIEAGPSVRVVTAATSFQVPDLAALGFAWPRSTSYRADLSAFAPRAADDVAAGAEQPPQDRDGAYAVAAAATFVTAP